MGKLICISELAKQLDVPKSWVYSRTRDHGPNPIPCLRVGKYIRFELELVLKWLRDRSV